MMTEPTEETKAYARRLLKEALPGLDDGNLRIIEQTSHPYWEQALAHAQQSEGMALGDLNEMDAKHPGWDEFKLTPVFADAQLWRK
jgi:hypothetical protein